MPCAGHTFVSANGVRDPSDGYSRPSLSGKCVASDVAVYRASAAGARLLLALPVTNDDNRNYIFSPEEAEVGCTGRCFPSDVRLQMATKPSND